jgi:FkbM family methyltransferase
MFKSALRYLDRKYLDNRLARSRIERRLRNDDGSRRASHIAFDRFQLDVFDLRSGDVAIDCGANMGKFTEILARSGATVYAFDPEPTVRERMENVAAAFDNVTFFPAAVGLTETPVRLYRPHDFDTDPVIGSQSVSVFAEKTNVSAESTVEVEQVDFFRFLQRVGPVRILKMDIEGAEVPILKRLLEDDALFGIDRIYVELHDVRLPYLAADYRWIRDVVAERFGDRVIVDWG